MANIKLFGVPSPAGFRQETSEGGDHKNAPPAIRTALKTMLAGYDISLGYDDLGDLPEYQQVPEMLAGVEARIHEIHSARHKSILLGGAHTLTLGSLRAIKKVHGEYSFVYIDAHPDCMPREAIDYGSTLYHAWNEGVLDPSRTMMVGIRKIETPEQQVLSERGIQSISPTDLVRFGLNRAIEQILSVAKPPIYVSLDIDSIDPTFAPGVTAPTPIGLSPREVLAIVESLIERGVCGVELVEVSPRTDRDQMTVKLTATLLQHISAAMAA